MSLSRLFRTARHRYRALWRSDAVERELREELAFHVAELEDEHVSDGMSTSHARQAALRTFGSTAFVEDQCRDERRVAWLQDFALDVRYGARLLRKQRALAVVAAVSLGVCIGTNAALLGVMHSNLLAQPFDHPGRLVAIRTVSAPNALLDGNATVPEYLAWKAQTRTLDNLSASIGEQKELVDANGLPPERVTGQGVSPELFAALGVAPLFGRTFRPDEDLVDHAAPVIVLSHRLWQRRFRSDPSVLGTHVRLSGKDTTIIGIMSADFRWYPADADYWAPLPITRFQLQGSGRFFFVIGRLKAHVTLEQAQAELNRPGVRVRSLNDSLFGWTREPLLILEGAALVVLLIACLNIVSLLTARGIARRPEFAMRVALGAGRQRILRQWLAESLLVSIAAAALAIGVARLGLAVLPALDTPLGGPVHIPDIGLNANVLSTIGALWIIVALSFSLVQLWASWPHTAVVASPLAAPRRHQSRHSWGREALLVGQVAMAVVVLVCSGLLIKTYLVVAWRDLGFNPKQLLTFDFRLAPQEYSHPIGSYGGFPYSIIDPPPSVTMQQVLQRVREVPAVKTAGAISMPPVNSVFLPMYVVTEDSSPTERASTSHRPVKAAYFVVTPQLFEALEAPMIGGRDFDDRDTVSSPWVAIVNQTMAEQLWPGQSPLGKRVRLDIVPEELPRQIIGVVHDIPTRRGALAQDPVIYASYLQQPSRFRGPWNVLGQMMFVLRTNDDPVTVAVSARRAVADVAPSRPVDNLSTLEARMDDWMRERRQYVSALSVLAVVATMLTAIGLCGLMAYDVAARTNEIGVRLALGARGPHVFRLIGGRAATVLAVGSGLGMAGSVAAAHYLAPLLWRVSPNDPAAFSAAVIMVVGLVGITCWWPLRRAMRIAPARHF